MLTEHEATIRNLDLQAEFERHLIERPEMLAQIPQDAQVVLLPEYDPDLYEHNFELYRRSVRQGDRVICVKVGSFADSVPPSRLRDVAITPVPQS